MNTDALRTTDAKSRAKVRDLMTAAVVAIGEAETVQAASVEMHWAHVRHLPVVDGVGRLIGLVTRAELQTALTLYDSAETLPVALVMRRDVFTVGPHTPLAEAMELMLDSKLTALPVVDRAARLVGILTESDFVRCVYRQLTGHSFQATMGHQERPTIPTLTDPSETAEQVRHGRSALDSSAPAARRLSVLPSSLVMNRLSVHPQGVEVMKRLSGRPPSVEAMKRLSGRPPSVERMGGRRRDHRRDSTAPR